MPPFADAPGVRLPDPTPVAAPPPAPSPTGAPTRARSRAGLAALQAAACYFMVTLTLGWMLGPIRDFWERAGADPLLAILCQAVATLLALVWAAGWVVSAFGVPDRTGARLAVGFGAIGALLACDAVAGYLMFAMTPLDLAWRFLSREGAVVGLSFLFAAILPAVRNRGSSDQ